MTIKEVCSHFDQSHIVDSQVDIDRDYYAAMEIMYSDGEIKSNVTREGNIHITSVHDANYIIFVDREYQTCLCIYRYTPDITYKYIIENLHLLKSKMNKSEENIEHMESDENTSDSTLIDINTFTCTECDSDNKMIFVRSKTNPEVLETKCNKCKSEYTFIPSKYYKLASKRTVYFKSEESSRCIKIHENGKRK